VDTPGGLVVPVIRDVDQKGVLQLAKETGEASAKARDGKLGPADMQGGSFSISSLGGIGGTHFTPIINAPKSPSSAYLNRQTNRCGRTSIRAAANAAVSLSYDHRAVDGAQGQGSYLPQQRVVGHRRVLL